MTIRLVHPAFLVALFVLFTGSAQAIEKAARAPGSAMERGKQLTAAGKLEDAVEAFTEAIEDDPHNWQAFVARSETYARLQLNTLADEDYDHAVEASPKAYEPLMTRAIARYFKKRYADAVADLDAAIRIAPDQVDLYHWRGCACAELGQFEKAVADFTRVIDHAPEQTDYRDMELQNRGVAEYNLGKFDKALEDYDAAEKAGRSTVGQRAECLLDMKRWKEAEEIYSDILRTTEDDSPDNVTKRYEALRNRAVALTGQKLFERAEADLTEAISVKPDSLYAYGTASWTRLFSGKTEEARAAALKALGMDADQLWIHLNLAHAYLIEGHFDWAKSIYLQDKDKRGSFGRTGVQIALQDIADLREAGIDHPDMARAEALLRTLPEATAAPAAESEPTASPEPASE